MKQILNGYHERIPVNGNKVIPDILLRNEIIDLRRENFELKTEVYIKTEADRGIVVGTLKDDAHHYKYLLSLQENKTKEYAEKLEAMKEKERENRSAFKCTKCPRLKKDLSEIKDLYEKATDVQQALTVCNKCPEFKKEIEDLKDYYTKREAKTSKLLDKMCTPKNFSNSLTNIHKSDFPDFLKEKLLTTVLGAVENMSYTLDDKSVHYLMSAKFSDKVQGKIQGILNKGILKRSVQSHVLSLNPNEIPDGAYVDVEPYH